MVGERDQLCDESEQRHWVYLHVRVSYSALLTVYEVALRDSDVRVLFLVDIDQLHFSLLYKVCHGDFSALNAIDILLCDHGPLCFLVDDD